MSIKDRERFSCRMYENKYPEIDDLVMVNVRRIAEMGAYVQLLEYNNIEGMVLLSELSRRRIRSVLKLIRVGRNEVVVVLRVDKDKGYIDLSKKRVSAEEIQKCEERFNKSKAVHAIVKHIAEDNNIATEELYSKYIWPLYKKYKHAHDAFKKAITKPDEVFGEFTDMPEKIKHQLLNSINKRLVPQKLKIRADIEVTCIGYHGIDAIKRALSEGEKCGGVDIPLKVRLVAPPLYVISTTCLDKVLGIEELNKAIIKIEDKIKEAGGSMTIKMQPKAVSDVDEKELDAMMKRAEMENAEVSGDEYNSDEDI